MAQKNERNQWNSTLKRRTPLKPKSGIKRPFNSAKKSPEARRKLFTTPQPKVRLKKISKKHKRALVKDYYPQQGRFLKFPENRYCWICIARSLKATRVEVIEIVTSINPEHLLISSGAIINRATEVHHRRGRCGRLLAFTPEFIPSCRGCREWPHTYLREARELDMLAPASDYNVFPEPK